MKKRMQQNGYCLIWFCKYFFCEVSIRSFYSLYKISLLNLNNLKQPILAYSHDGDDFSNPTTLSFLSKLDLVNFIDYSSSDCEGQIMTGGDHGISIDKCFGNKDSRQNEITDYLKSINF